MNLSSLHCMKLQVLVVQDLGAPMNRKGHSHDVHSTQKSRVVVAEISFSLFCVLMWVNEFWQSYYINSQWQAHSKYCVSVCYISCMFSSWKTNNTVPDLLTVCFIVTVAKVDLRTFCEIIHPPHTPPQYIVNVLS